MNPALHGATPEGFPDGIDIGYSEPLVLAGGAGHLQVSGQYEWVQDRLVPAWLDFDFAGEVKPGKPSVTGRIELRDGAPRVTLLAFESRAGDGEVRQGTLRDVQVDALVMLLAAFSYRLKRSGPGEVDVSLSNEGEPLVVAHEALRSVRSNRRITPELLSDVAQVYRANLSTGPTKAVREQFFVSERMAANYVQRARKIGLLPETTRGKKRG